MQLGEVYFDIAVNESSVTKSLESIKEKFKSVNSLGLNISVNDSELTKLNKHIELKKTHLISTQNYFKSNPLKIYVDDSDLKKALNQKTTISVSKGISQDGTKERVSKYDNTQMNVQLNEISSKLTDIVSELKDLNKSTINNGKFRSVEAVQRGLFEGMGRNFTDAVTKGLANSVKDSFKVNLADVTKRVANVYAAPFNRDLNKDIFGADIEGVSEKKNPRRKSYNSTRKRAQQTTQVDFAETIKKVGLYEPVTVPQAADNTKLNNSQIQSGIKVMQAMVNKNFSGVIDNSLDILSKELKKEKPDIESAKKEFEKIKAGFATAYKSMQKSLSENNRALAKVYAQAILSTSEKAKEDIKKITDSLAKSGLPDKFGSELKTLSGSTKGVITSRYVNPTKRVLTDIQNTEDFDKSVDVGKEVLSGIVSGLKDKKPVIREGSDLSLTLLNAIRKSLGIASPARKIIELMGFVRDGAVLGLRNSKAAVSEAATNLFNTVAPVGERLKKKATEKIKKTFPNLLPVTLEEYKEKAQYEKNSIVDPLGMTHIKRLINAAKQGKPLPSNLDPETGTHTSSLKLAPDAGSQRFFESQYDRLSKKVTLYANQEFGKKEGYATARQMLVALAIQFPVIGKYLAAAPLATPLIPTALAFRVAKKMITPIVEQLNLAVETVVPRQLALTNLTGSVEKGVEKQKYLDKFTTEKGVNLKEGTKGFVDLSFATKGTKLEGQPTQDLFEGISSASKFVGASSEETKLIFQSFIQMVSKGKISMEELRLQLSEKFPPAMGVFAKALGVSSSELVNLISSGSLLSEDVLPKVAKILKKDFGQSIDSAANSFVNSTNRMDNAFYKFQTQVFNSYGGFLAFYNNINAGIYEAVANNFTNISKIINLSIITIVASAAAGFTAIVSSKSLAPKLAIFTNLFNATFKKGLSSSTPFIAGTFIDLIDDVFGAKNNVYDNIGRGITNAVIAAFSIADNLVRSFTSKGIFSVNLDSLTDATDHVGELKKSFVGLFKLIPSGVVEMFALVLAIQQMGLLGATYVLPTLDKLYKSLKLIGTSIKDAVFNVGNIRDSFKDFFPGVIHGAKNILGIFTGLATQAGIALVTMALAQSDFANPLQKSFNDASENIRNSITGIRNSLNELKEASITTGKTISENFKLKSKGIELNPLKILGISDETTSYKSDDLFEAVNKFNKFNKFSKILGGRSSGAKKKLEKAYKDSQALGLDNFVDPAATHLTEAQKQLLGSAQDFKSQGTQLITTLNKLRISPEKLPTLLNEKSTQKNLTNIRELDKQLKTLGGKRAELGLINTPDAKLKIKDIDKELEGLKVKRNEKIQPLGKSIEYLKEIQDSIKKQKEAVDKSDYPLAAKKALNKLLKPQEDLIKKSVDIFKQEGIENLTKPLEENWSKLLDVLVKTNVEFERFKNNSALVKTKEETKIVSRFSDSESTQKMNLDNLNLGGLTKDREELSKVFDVHKKTLTEFLSISNAEGTDTRKKEIDDLREQVKKESQELADYDLNIIKQREQIYKSQVALTKNVADYYQGILSESEVAALDTKKILKGSKTNEAQNKLRKVLETGHDNIVTQYIDSIIESLGQNNDISDKTIEAQKALVQFKQTGYEQQKAYNDITRSIPENISAQLTEPTKAIKSHQIVDEKPKEVIKNQLDDEKPKPIVTASIPSTPSKPKGTTVGDVLMREVSKGNYGEVLKIVGTFPKFVETHSKEKFSEINKKISDFLDENEISTKIKRLGDDFRNIPFTPFVQTLTSSITDGLKSIQELSVTGLRIASESLTNFFNKVGQSFSNYYESLKADIVSSEAFQQTADYFTEFGSYLNQSASDISNYFQSVYNNIANSEALKQTTDYFTEFNNYLSKSANNIFISFQKAFSATSESGKQFSSDISVQFTKAIDTINPKEKFSRLGQDFNKFADDTGKTFLKIFAKPNTTSLVSKEDTDNLAQQKQQLEGILKFIQANTVETKAWTNTVDATKKLYSDTNDVLANQLTNTQLYLNDIWSKTVDTLKYIPDIIVDSVNKTINWNGRLAEIQDQWNLLVQTSTDWLNSILTPIQQGYQSLVNSITAATEKTINWVKETLPIKEIMQGINDSFAAIGGVIDGLIEKTNQWFQGITQATSALSIDASTGITKAANGFGESVKEGWNQAVQWATGGSKIKPTGIVESVGNSVQNVKTYTDLEKHHPSAGIQSGRNYDKLDGHLEEVRNVNGQRFVKKDFILDGGRGAPVASPVGGIIKQTGDEWNTTHILDPQTKQILATFLHLSNIIKSGTEVKPGDRIGSQSDVGSSGSVHVHAEMTRKLFESYIPAIVSGDFTKMPPGRNSVSQSSLSQNLIDLRNKPSQNLIDPRLVSSAPITKYGHYAYKTQDEKNLTSVGNGQRLDTEAATAFKSMAESAKQAGIDLNVISGYRSVEQQKQVFEQGRIAKGQTEAQRAKVSAPAGFSQHQTGFALDINSTEDSFGKTPAYKWLQNNAQKFGFTQSFKEGNSQGIANEPWHWAYGGSSRAKNMLTPLTQSVNTQSDVTVPGLTPLGNKYANLLNNPKVRAFLRAIAIAEVGETLVNAGKGYGKQIGGDYSKEEFSNPENLTRIPASLPGRRGLNAFGRYQFHQPDLVEGNKIGVRNLSPQSQDIIAVQKLAYRGALEPLLKGDIATAIKKAGDEWASLAGSKHAGDGLNATTEGGKLPTFVRNYQQGLNPNAIGSIATPISGSPTANNVVQSALQYRPVSNTNLKQTVDEARQIQINSTNQQQQAQVVQSQRDFKKDRSEFIRKQRAAQETFIRAGESLDASVTSRERAHTDLSFQNLKNPATAQTQNNEITGILRKYDDLLLSYNQAKRDAEQRIQVSQEALVTGEIPEGQSVGLLNDRLKKDNIEIANLKKSIPELEKLRAQAIAESEKLFRRDESLRLQNTNFEIRAQELQKTRGDLEALKNQSGLAPYRNLALEIPALEKSLSLKEADLELERAIADIEDKRYKNTFSADSATNDKLANEQIELLKKNNVSKQEGIELTYQQADANAKLEVGNRILERENTLLGIRNDMRQEELKTLELIQKRNPLIRAGEQLNIQKNIDDETRKTELIKKQFDITNDTRLSPLERLQDLARISDLYRTKEKNANEQFAIDTEQQNITNLQTLATRNSSQREFLSKPGNDLVTARANQITSLGGNQFEANALQRPNARLQENNRYAAEIDSFNSQSAELKFQGLITDDQIGKMREALAAIHDINLENVNEQFKTFGSTINDIAKSSIKGLSSGLADVIVKGGSLVDVFNNFAETLLSGVIQAGLDSLLSSLTGSLFGGKKGGGGLGGLLGGGGGGGGILDFVSSIFGGGGGLGGILGFASGGEVPYLSGGGAIRDTETALGRALKREGANSVISTLTPGERVLNREENRLYNALHPDGILNLKVRNFNKGGELIPSISESVVSGISSKGSTNVSVNASIESQGGKGADERQLAKSIRAVVIAELSRQDRIKNS